MTRGPLLIVGANGQLGRDLLAAAARRGLEAAGRDLPELDVSDPQALRQAMEDLRPWAVVNCAAFHEVDRCESELDAAFRVNALGALQAARAAKAAGAKFVHLSTDYVFDGIDRRTPYFETDEPAPRSVYAKSKRAGELLALSAYSAAVVVRSCGLYGVHPPAGKPYNFPQIMLKLAREEKPIRVVDDQICTPTWTQPLAETILNVLDSPLAGIVHATAQGQCSWCEFAQAIFALAGVEADVKPISSADYGAAAPRPAYSVLENARLKAAGLDALAPWRTMLAAYLAECRAAGGVRATPAKRRKATPKRS
ncbi:MAG: dTDP-4-dehydrorhamnose reductase [Myxococcales bacterium]|nr:MAG: dTDP-4-dehydrorhamnose reductase [Myxococcales bacterium]